MLEIKRFDTSARPAHNPRLYSSPSVITQSAGTARLYQLPEPLVGVSLRDVTGCRWPVNDSLPHMFCNQEQQAGRSYCTQHVALAYRAVQDRSAFFQSQQRSNIVPTPPAKPRPTKTAKSPSTSKHRHIPTADQPFSADSMRGIVYALLIDRHMTQADVVEATGWSLKQTRETIADLRWWKTCQDRYVCHMEDHTYWIEPNVVDVSAMIG